MTDSVDYSELSRTEVIRKVKMRALQYVGDAESFASALEAIGLNPDGYTYQDFPDMQIWFHIRSRIWYCYLNDWVILEGGTIYDITDSTKFEQDYLTIS